MYIVVRSGAVDISVSEARAALPQLLRRVEEGEEITLTRHGRAVAVLVRPDALRARRAGAALAEAERLHALVEEARDRPLPRRSRISHERAEQLVADVRAGRRR